MIIYKFNKVNLKSFFNIPFLKGKKLHDVSLKTLQVIKHHEPNICKVNKLANFINNI
jgi:hypothetical protein